MTFGQSISTCFGNYVNFSGRAGRAEFWWFALFVFVVQIVLVYLDISLFGVTETSVTETDGGFEGSARGFTSFSPLSTIFALAVLLPYLAVSVRRLHDTGRTGWLVLISLIPVIGIIVLIVWWAQKGEPGENAHGPAPAS